MRCLLHVALLGLRRGELLALRWRDVDLEKAELRVEHALSYIPFLIVFLVPLFLIDLLPDAPIIFNHE